MKITRATVFALLVAAAVAAGARAGEALNTLDDGERLYRAFVPDRGAAIGKRPLVVYLHPSGDERLEEFRRDYWPMLSDNGCVTAVPVSKGQHAWLAGEDVYIREVIADAEKRYDTDPKRVMLLGVAGGGQVALILADREPRRFRAVVLVSANPVSVRGSRIVWFFPSRTTLKDCPYFVVNHLTEGSALMYWRQVREKLAQEGLSLSIVPVLGAAGPYLPPPAELRPWLEEVLAGKQPAPLPDSQKEAVARMLRPAVEALGKALEKAAPAKVAGVVRKDGPRLRVSIPVPEGFEESARKADAEDSAGRPITQVRLANVEWPISVRCDARAAAEPMEEVLAADERETVLRGLLYQVYREVEHEAGGRTWRVKIGSITYPDRERGWVTALFLQAVAPLKDVPGAWLEALVADETQEPDAKELAGVLNAVLWGVAASPAPPSTQPATRPAATSPADR